MIDLTKSPVICAQSLLGCHIVRELNGHKLVGKIVETEAYDEKDAASHSFKGITPRTEVMFGPPGFAYVYFTYGMHYCFNVVCGPIGIGSAVLIRAIEPVLGVEIMNKNRKGIIGVNTTNGPAKLCYALKINKDLNGHNLAKKPLYITDRDIEPKIVKTTRIGITKDTHRKWRFYIKSNDFVSKK